MTASREIALVRCGAACLLRLVADHLAAAILPVGQSIAVVVAILLLTVIAGSSGRAAERRRQRAAVAADGPMSMEGLPGGSLTGSERAMLERRFAVIDTDGNRRWQRDGCTR